MLSTILLSATFAVAQPQAPPIAQAPPVARIGKPAQMSDDYTAHRARAIEQGKPIVYFVGIDKRPIAGAVSVRIDKHPTVEMVKGIIVGVPDRNLGLALQAKLSPNANDAQILNELEVSRPANPFDNIFARRKTRIVDADVPASGRWYTQNEINEVRKLWPRSMPFVAGLKFYWPTTLSQRIAVTNNSPSNDWYPDSKDDIFANAPTSFNPNRHDPRWAAPGGLVGIHGWESYTAAAIPSAPHVWSQPVPIANGGTIPGGILWRYPSETLFADLLVSDGKPFELRYREKREDGSWDSYVAWRDVESRPLGYFGAGKRCSVCHDLAGGSEQYGITIRGKDTVFSYLPFDLK